MKGKLQRDQRSDAQFTPRRSGSRPGVFTRPATVSARCERRASIRECCARMLRRCSKRGTGRNASRKADRMHPGRTCARHGLATLVAGRATPITAMLALALAPAALAGDNAVAMLSGDEEVPARDTQAMGVATFKLREDGAALEFKLKVANIDNVVAAHIHCGAVGVNGPVGVTLFTGPAGRGSVNGTLAEGTITAANAGNGCGWTDLASVLAAMDSGNTYVNVHTNDGVAPANTGPGDFPGGEIRGQIR